MLCSLWADLTTKSPGFSRCRRRSFEIFKRKRTSQPKKSHAGRPILLSDRDRRSPTRELAKSGSSVGKAAARIGLEVSRHILRGVLFDCASVSSIAKVKQHPHGSRAWSSLTAMGDGARLLVKHHYVRRKEMELGRSRWHALQLAQSAEGPEVLLDAAGGRRQHYDLGRFLWQRPHSTLRCESPHGRQHLHRGVAVTTFACRRADRWPILDFSTG